MSSKLTLRRPTCQSWHIKVFFSSHGSAWTAMSKVLTQNGEKYSLNLNRADFMKILSVLQDNCGSHNNIMKFFRKIILFIISLLKNFNFFMVKNSFWCRYLFGVLSTCENLRENFEEILPRLDRLCQIWRIGRLGPMLFGGLRVNNR